MRQNGDAVRARRDRAVLEGDLVHGSAAGQLAAVHRHIAIQRPLDLERARGRGRHHNIARHAVTGADQDIAHAASARETGGQWRLDEDMAAALERRRRGARQRHRAPQFEVAAVGGDDERGGVVELQGALPDVVAADVAQRARAAGRPTR
jgi:hypothetical protein